jgi:hypothetical protein
VRNRKIDITAARMSDEITKTTRISTSVNPPDRRIRVHLEDGVVIIKHAVFGIAGFKDALMNLLA